jgi:hypothetical protein
LNKIINFVIFVVVVTCLYQAYSFYNGYLDIQEKLRVCSITSESDKVLGNTVCNNIGLKVTSCESKLTECMSSSLLCKDNATTCNSKIDAANRNTEFYKKSYEQCKSKLSVINFTTTTLVVPVTTTTILKVNNTGV